jgi:hypothetical protein
MHRRGVALDEIGIVLLAGVRVVQDVVLVDPRLGDLPVGPIEQAPAATREDLARVLLGHARHAVVAAMADVVHQHPARRTTERQERHRQRVRRDAGEQRAERRARPSPPLHLAQVREVVGAEIGFDVGADRAELAQEPFEIDALGIEGFHSSRYTSSTCRTSSI